MPSGVVVDPSTFMKGDENETHVFDSDLFGDSGKNREFKKTRDMELVALLVSHYFIDGVIHKNNSLHYYPEQHLGTLKGP